MLAGHLHGGQICMPWPGGRVGLAHPRSGTITALESCNGTVMHVSPGLGTTFVPFRLFAQPEVTLLRLRPRDGVGEPNLAASAGSCDGPAPTRPVRRRIAFYAPMP